MSLITKTTLKSLTIILFMLLLQSCSTKNQDISELSLEGIPVYTIKGFKDERIDAIYSILYVSANLDRKECTQVNFISSSKKPVIGSRSYYVEDGNYTLDIPIELTDDMQGCGFKFRELELIMKRKGDPNYNAKTYFPILYNKPIAGTRYQTRSDNKSETPVDFKTDKSYFRIAPDTSFHCRTIWHDNLEPKRANFYCAMKIDSGDKEFHPTERNVWGEVTNPQFGVDEIIDSNLTINIVVDDNRSLLIDGIPGYTQDYFREYIPPKKSFLQRLFD